MKHYRAEHGYRTAVVPVRLSGSAYRQAHEACHEAALLWNSLKDSLWEFWEVNQRDPKRPELMAEVSGEFRGLHSHSRQAVFDDLMDAVFTVRSLQKQGLEAKMPSKDKNYRPLSFTRGYGWRVSKDGQLVLSMGRGNKPIITRLPEIWDLDTGEEVPANTWGEIRLCWNKSSRKWSLHIAAPKCAPLPKLNPENVMAIDEGIINPMTVAVETKDAYEVTVINGRYARNVRRRRNLAVARAQSEKSKTLPGSKKRKRLERIRRRAEAKAAASLHNIDHQVSAKVADFAKTHDCGTIVAGDVRGIEQNTKKWEKKRRRNPKAQRRRLSQWSRGRQERYLSEKTGVPITHINEAYSSKTCPQCSALNRPSGRRYRCSQCDFICHRDAVGALNILQRARFGSYVPIDTNKPIRVTHLRATPISVRRSTGQMRPTTKEEALTLVV